MIVDMLAQVLKDEVEVLFTGAREAEAIKLFNTYLAMRCVLMNWIATHWRAKWIVVKLLMVFR